MPQGLRHGDLGMKKNKNGAGIDKSISLFVSIILVFGEFDDDPDAQGK